MNNQDLKNYTIQQIEKLKNSIRILNKPNATFFSPPMTLSEIVKFEVTKHIRITDDFREWLKFSSGCSVDNGNYQLFFPLSVNEFDNQLPADETAIGAVKSQNIIFSVNKLTGHFSIFEKGTKRPVGCFGEIIDLISQYITEYSNDTGNYSSNSSLHSGVTPQNNAYGRSAPGSMPSAGAAPRNRIYGAGVMSNDVMPAGVTSQNRVNTDSAENHPVQSVNGTMPGNESSRHTIPNNGSMPKTGYSVFQRNEVPKSGCYTDSHSNISGNMAYQENRFTGNSGYNGSPNFVFAPQRNISELNLKIKKICDLGKQYSQSYPSFFDTPASETQISQIERANGSTIPLSYRTWLKNFRCCSIFGDTFRFFMPESNGYYNALVPHEYLVIGEMVGDGERICISKRTGKIIAVYHDEITEYDDFEMIIDAILKLFEDFEDAGSYSDIIDPQSDQMKFMSDKELYEYIMKPKPEKYREAQKVWNMYLSSNDKRREEFISYLKLNKQKYKNQAFRNNYFEEIMFMLRVCAVKDFWNNERDLICHGQGTVNWNPEQQKRIMNVNSINKMMSKNAAPGIVFDDRGDIVVNQSGMNVLYDAHQMCDVYHYPQFAAMGRNIQALTPCAHIMGAHALRFV